MKQKIQFTLFTEDLKKGARSLELNTPLELVDTENLNKGLISLFIKAAVKLQPTTYQRRDEIFSLLCPHQLSYQHTKSPQLKRKERATIQVKMTNNCRGKEQVQFQSI
ncbi:unnamed protein product [Cuscuta campestris]|uniref:Uncharacterized protein n=1 Tax=Cuscuta campestris TaxID=132261 RepID=A0A484M2Q5_9ASTE|nr:unnamed protein product [Cuscuta campestris]